MAQRSQTNNIQEGQPDWLTITSGSGEFADPLADDGMRLLRKVYTRSEIKKWMGLGYIGHQGEHIKVGVRGAEETIVMLSGSECWEHSKEIRVSNYRVTRFDLQVTISFSEPLYHVAQGEYEDLLTANLARQRKRYLKLIQSNGGETLYVGKRTSAVMLRLYDATFHYLPGKTGLYWRYEVEFKRTAAQKAYDVWSEADDKFKHTVSQVGAEFEKRTVDPRFPKGSVVAVIQTSSRVATDEGRLKWITKCVAPVVVQLVWNGELETVLECLRLKELVTIKE